MKNKIEKTMKGFKNFQGVIKVTKGSQLIFEKAYGYFDKKNKIKNELDSKFLIGSITKMITAVAIMKLQEENKLDIDEPVIKYLDNLEIEYFIKIKDLLAHKSGIKDFILERNTIDIYSEIAVDEIIREMLKRPRIFSVGEDISYSNTGYLILARIIEKASGMLYADYIRENIFIPLKMTNSEFYHEQSIIAKGYMKNKRVAIFNESAFYGSGNIVSTTDDLIKFINGFKENKILTKESFDIITTIHGFNITNKYGYGVLIKDKFRDRSIGHGGTYPIGYSTIVSNYKNSNINIVI